MLTACIQQNQGKKMDILAFTVQEKVQCVSWYIQTNSTTTVRRNFHTKYGKNPPARTTILRWVENFNSQGNVENTTGRGRPSVSEQTVQTVSTYFHTHPQRSLRRAVIDLSIPYSTIQKILKKQIHMFPYKIRTFHELKPQDYVQRLAFVQWCMEKISSDPNFLRRIVFSDECVFHVSGIANTQNTRIWGSENPRQIQEHEAHSEKITVWCAIHANGVLDPYYFFNETVRGDDYFQMLNTYVRSEAAMFPQNALFQQDGAPPHTTREVRSLLNELFPNSWIGRYGPRAWPARSPDLTPPDFFLWGFVKDKVFETSVSNITQLKRRITTAIRSVTQEMLNNVWRNLENRFHAIIRESGGHIEHL